MSSLWKGNGNTCKFYYGGLKLYPKDSLYQEMAFISYYFHWSSMDVMTLDHQSRRRWCKEISEIHKSINPSKEKGSKEISILDMKPTKWF